MRCPYCNGPLLEDSEDCPSCRLNLGRVNTLLGPVPRFEPGISDDGPVILPRQKKALLRRIEKLRRRFPQIRIQIICREFPTDHPLPLYLFWIFNNGNFGDATEKAGNNRLILITLDPYEGRSAMMVGYGLEPFVSDETLDEVLSLAEQPWRNSQWADGLAVLLDGLELALERSLRKAGEVLGIPTSLWGSDPADF